MPAPCSSRVAVRMSSSVVPFSIASRIFCDPDSAPIQTVWHLAAASALTTAGLTRSARSRHLNGSAHACSVANCAKRSSQRGFKPSISSANQIWSGWYVSISHFNSATTFSGERELYRCPQMGLAHQLQWYGQPRVVTMFIEK